MHGVICMCIHIFICHIHVMIIEVASVLAMMCHFECKSEIRRLCVCVCARDACGWEHLKLSRRLSDQSKIVGRFNGMSTLRRG